MNMNLSSSSEEDDDEGYSSNDEDIAHIVKQQDRSRGSMNSGGMNSSTRTRTNGTGTGTGTPGIHTRTPAFITNGIHICSKFKSSPMSTNHAVAKQSDLISVHVHAPVHVLGHVQNSQQV